MISSEVYGPQSLIPQTCNLSYMDGPGEGAASTIFFHGAASCQSRGMEISHEGVYNVYPWLKFQKTKFRSIFVMKATPVGQINIYLET